MSPTELEPLLLKFRSRAVVVDTNLMLLLIAGKAGPRVLREFDPIRRSGFTGRDFDLLSRIISFFTIVKVTPHILAEVSNHGDKLHGRLKQRFDDSLKALIGGAEEHFDPARTLSLRPEFNRFGIADTGIAELGRSGHLILTADFPLAGHLQKMGLPVVNFTNLRAATWVE